jgi:hypothetical protein
MSPISSVLPSAAFPSALNSGAATIAAGNQQLNQDAVQIANPDNQDLINPLLNLSQARLMAEAGADVIGASNEMLGTLIDVFA